MDAEFMINSQKVPRRTFYLVLMWMFHVEQTESAPNEMHCEDRLGLFSENNVPRRTL